MKRIIKASLDNSKFYYLITIGSGLAWVYQYVVETDEQTSDYGYLMDELIDYIDEHTPKQLIDPNSDDDYVLKMHRDGSYYLAWKDNPREVAWHDDEFLVGGNYGKILLHYGALNIREISPEDAEKFIENKDTILIEV